MRTARQQRLNCLRLQVVVTLGILWHVNTYLYSIDKRIPLENSNYWRDRIYWEWFCLVWYSNSWFFDESWSICANDWASSGIYHYCGDEPCSWFDFARAIFLEAEVQGLKTPSYVKSIKTADYPTPAIRPAYSVLDCSKIESCFEVTRSNWRDGISIVIDRLKG